MRAWRDKTRLLGGLAILVATPLVATVILSVWWIEAERASLDAKRIALAERSAAELANAIDEALLSAILPLHDTVFDANRSGSSAAMRSLIASDPRIAFAAIDGEGHHSDFPPKGEMMAFYEDWVLERLGALLTRARDRVNRIGETVWLGSALSEGPAVVTCRPLMPAGSACIVLEGGALQALARQIIEAELEGHPDRPAIIQNDGAVVWSSMDADHEAAGRASLSEPFDAWAVSVPLIAAGSPAWSRHALFASLMLAILLATAAFLYGNHERQLREAGQRIEILAQIAHELRTPLANLQLYAALLQKEASPADRIRYGAVLEQECARLAGLIENTLSMARAERTGGSVREDANPDAILGDLVERFRPLLDANRSSVSLDFGVGRTLSFDRLAYERILINLIDNACTHAPGAAIHIWTRAGDSSLDFGVEDGGPGIAEDRRMALFEAFETSRADGFGLGLATCRSLSEAAGGSIRYDDGAEGAGFHVSLPISPKPLAMSEAVSSKERPACAS